MDDSLKSLGQEPSHVGSCFQNEIIAKELGLHHCRPNSHSNKRIKWKKKNY